MIRGVTCWSQDEVVVAGRRFTPTSGGPLLKMNLVGVKKRIRNNGRFWKVLENGESEDGKETEMGV